MKKLKLLLFLTTALSSISVSSFDSATAITLAGGGCAFMCMALGSIACYRFIQWEGGRVPESQNLLAKNENKNHQEVTRNYIAKIIVPCCSGCVCWMFTLLSIGFLMNRNVTQG